MFRGISAEGRFSLCCGLIRPSLRRRGKRRLIGRLLYLAEGATINHYIWENPVWNQALV